MSVLEKELLQKEQQLKDLLNQIESKKSPAIDGRLRITHKRGKPVYYLDLNTERTSEDKQKENQKRHSKYIRKSEMEKIILLAQQDYEEKLCDEINKQLKALRSVITASKKYDENALENVYTRMHPCRKELIKPIVPDSDTFAKEWMEKPFVKKQISDFEMEIYTDKGERVRSKSEKIIADKYLKLGIPYRYESQLVLMEKGRPVTIYPDFTVLNKNTRKEYYHEHFGKMDSEEYCKSAMKRVELYTQNGIFVGDQLIITHETSDRPLSMPCFEKLIKKYLLS